MKYAEAKWLRNNRRLGGYSLPREAGADMNAVLDSDGSASGRAMLDQKQLGLPWWQSKWLALLEFLLVGLIFVADATHWIPFSKVPFLLILGWLSLRLRRMGWRQVGLSLYHNWARTLLLGVGAGILLE